MWRPGLRSRLAATLGGVLLATAFARPAAAGEAGGGIGELMLSSRVAEFGRTAKDPVALIVAASIRAKVATKTIARAPEGAAGEAPAEGREPSVAGLLDEAVALSNRDPAIVAMAEDVRASKTKGRVEGIAESVATVKPAGIDWYRKIAFEGTRYAEAYIELFGDGRLLVSVWDEQGNLVCKDPNPSSTSYCGWNPSRTARYDLKIENLGQRPVRYKISTN